MEPIASTNYRWIQVQTSIHRDRGMIETEKCSNWSICFWNRSDLPLTISSQGPGQYSENPSRTSDDSTLDDMTSTRLAFKWAFIERSSSSNQRNIRFRSYKQGPMPASLRKELEDADGQANSTEARASNDAAVNTGTIRSDQCFSVPLIDPIKRREWCRDSIDFSRGLDWDMDTEL